MDNELFYHTCKELLKKWNIATKVNMTNLQQNRKSWLGAAACCFKFGVPEFLTRIAWNLLNKEDQDKANMIAEKIINEYEQTKNNINEQTLF